jgi:toxin-antitoxin system PIN domain toxin
MTSSTPTSWILPDVNVWLALYFDGHGHHASANRWYRSLDPSPALVFCRQTQLGLFRLLSTEVVMDGNRHTQRQCWRIFDEWVENDQARFLDEPPGMTKLLRNRTSEEVVAPKMWMDAYLAAFAEASRLTLITFDRALAGRVAGSVLLG